MVSLKARIWKSERWYVAEIRELGIVTQGRTVGSARRNLKEATRLYMDAVIDGRLPRRARAPAQGQLVSKRAGCKGIKVVI